MLKYVGFKPFSEKKYKKVLELIKCMHILAALILVHKLFFKTKHKQIFMKKIILSLVAAATLLATTVNAQTTTEADYKPAAGDNTLELQLAPLGAAPFSMGGIRYRRFLDATTALRATVYLGYTSSTEVTQQADEFPGAQELKTKNSSFEIGIRPGIEKHLAGTSRLSPYFGGELDFAIKTSKEKEEVQAGTDVEENVIKNEDGFTRFGLNGIFGADYYIAPKVFLGAELGFGFAFTKDSKTVTEPAGGGDTVTEKGGGSFILAPNVLAQFRLGIVF